MGERGPEFRARIAHIAVKPGETLSLTLWGEDYALTENVHQVAVSVGEDGAVRVTCDAAIHETWDGYSERVYGEARAGAGDDPEARE